jgi:hypothetical protein
MSKYFFEFCDIFRCCACPEQRKAIAENDLTLRRFFAILEDFPPLTLIGGLLAS